MRYWFYIYIYIYINEYNLFTFQTKRDPDSYWQTHNNHKIRQHEKFPCKHQQEARKISIKRLLFTLRALTARHIDWNAVTPLLREQCEKTHTIQAFQQFKTLSNTFNMLLTRINYLSISTQHQYSPRNKIQKISSVKKTITVSAEA